MNFVGHAIAARWEDSDPRHGAGAMLPDLARMCGVATPPATDAVVVAGVRCHHRVDAAFHDAECFLALMRQARAWLADAGVPRPCALATAHVGVELLLDGAFMRTAERVEAFTAAAAGACELTEGALTWPDPPSRARFGMLCARLPELAGGYGSPEVVGDRVVRILSRRPRLAPDPIAAASIRAWAMAAAPSVVAVADDVLHELRTRLEAVP